MSIVVKEKVKSGEKKLKKKVRRDVAKILNKGKFGQFVTLTDPYARSILDPFNEHGAKVPDFNDQPSATFSVVYRLQVTGNANGVAMACFGLSGDIASTPGGSLVPAPLFNVSASKVTGGPIGCRTDAGAASTSLFPSGTGSNVPLFLDDFKFSPSNGQPTTAVPNMFEKVRLVSAGAGINYLGNQLQSQGMFVVASAPRNYNRYRIFQGTQPITVDDIMKIPGSKAVPINTLRGASCTYRPIDEISTTYCDMDGATDSSAVGMTDWYQRFAAYAGGELYLVASGLNTDTPPSFIVTFVANYEGIPRRNTIDLAGASPSPVDPIRFSNAMNKVSRVPTTVGQTDEIQGLEEGGYAVEGGSQLGKLNLKALGSGSLASSSGGSKVVMRTKARPHVADVNFLDRIGEYIDSGGQVVDKFFNLNKKMSSPLLKLIMSLGIL